MGPFASLIAPQVDRLVLGINRQVGPRHGRVLGAVADELGLDSLKLIPHFADFWLTRPLRHEVAEARLPYAPAGSVQDRFDVLEALDLVRQVGPGLEATARFRLLLVAVVAAREDVVVRTWATLPPGEIGGLIQRVIDAIPESYTVAIAHRNLTAAPNPALRLYDQLVTLRYVRQHDHVEAWRAVGMTAGEMKVITPLWLRESPPDDSVAVAELARRGLVEAGTLTERGRRARDQIEEETDRRSGSVWSALDADERQLLLEALSQMRDSTTTSD